MSCRIEDCPNKERQGGFCQKHYDLYLGERGAIVRGLMDHTIHSSSLCLPRLSLSDMANMCSLVRALPGKKGL